MMNGVTLKAGDCLDILREMPEDSVDMTICSPPYEAARTYGIGFALRGQDWVDWAVARYVECVRVTRGLICWVVEGQTKNFRWSAAPALLMADLHRAGVQLRKPPIFHRIGIPGSGGPDWWRNDYEFCVCASKGKLPWSKPTAIGHKPKYGPGGDISHRCPDGSRRNSKHRTFVHAKSDGDYVLREARKIISKKRDGMHSQTQNGYTLPTIANPGNILKTNVGGGAMGSRLAHENEAPFPERLVEKFVLCFCPPDGTVLDCFCGSGTSLAVAVKNGRKAIGIDVRDSQIELSRRRIAEVMLPLFD